MTESSSPATETPTAGVVGLGAMGRPAAEYLAASPFETFAYDLDAAALDAIEKKGATTTSSLRELADKSTVVFVFVPSDDDVRTVCLGEDGLLAGARPGSVIAICSSALPETCDAVAAAGREKGVDVLDAALTGGVRGAEAGQINLLVGGDEAVLDRIRPLLDPWCGSVHHLGGLGAGQVGKTVNNLIHWAQIAAIVESLELGRRYGLDVPTLRRALLDGPTASRTLAELEQMRFTWHVKDLANAEVMAEAVGLPLPVAATSRTAMTAITVPQVAELLAASPDMTVA
jgi:3-hydroxyisobutyrate dehydrogenase-like beta-hydroxyacid dehydrogenase